MRAIVIATVMACCYLGASVRAAEMDPTEIRLDDSRWQSLPVGIEQVFVSPDGRVWYQDRRTYWRPDLAQLKEELAAQFNQKSPRVRGAELLLFEPGPRVWFYAHHLLTMLAFDGKEWITNTIEDYETEPQGRCLTQGGLINSDIHCFAGGAVWLIGKKGVYRYDGKAWDYQAMTTDLARPGMDLLLSVHPDGKVAVAHQRRSAEVWLYHEGRWAKHKLFEAGTIPEVAHWAFESPRDILYVDVEHQRYVIAKPRIQRLLIQQDGGFRRDEPKAGAFTFGGERVSSVRAMYTARDGRIYLAADAIGDVEVNTLEQAEPGRDKSLLGGIVIRDPDGKARIIRAEGLAGAFVSYPPPLVTPSRTQIWLANRAATGRAYLFDLDKAESVERLPSSNFGNLRPVADQGRLFVSRGSHGSGMQPIMVYTPGGPELPVLKVTTKETGLGPVAVSEDRTMWTVDKDGHVICFENGDWNRIRSEPLRHIDAFIPGRGGMALIHADGMAILCERSKVIASGELFELLENQIEWIVRRFGPDKPAPSELWPIQVVASRSGRIWCIINYSLRLFVKDRWYDATDALIAAGSRGGHAMFVAPIGNGDRVFVSDLRLRHDGGRSFFGQLEGKQLKFTDAPHSMHSDTMPYMRRDSDDGLWLSATDGRALGTADEITGQLAVHVRENGVASKLSNGGRPQLIDQAGHVWLSSIWGKPSDIIQLWREGQIHQQIRIPAYVGGLICSDRPGSVYAATAVGLQHLEADAPDYNEYRLGQLYTVEDIDRPTQHQAFSRNGYVVFTTNAGRSSLFHQVELPKR